MMESLLPRAEAAAAILKRRKLTIAIGESSAGGLISAALLAVPGASAYFLGGNVLYTRRAWHTLKDFDKTAFDGARSATEANALIRARLIRTSFGADWAVAETGAAGPTGNRYGDAAGHTCFAIAGAVERAGTLETGKSDRLSNMYAFAAAALELLVECLNT
jgi:nicotinamide-nucleotide amidase